jgi:hypothetical protein
MRKVAYFLLFTAMLIAASCVKDSVSNINDSTLVSPSYSVPIGLLTYSLSELAPGMLDLETEVDTALIPDTIPLIQYNNLFVPNPGSFDTVHIKDFNFSSIQNFLENTTSLMFRLNITNGLPTTNQLQIYLVDEADVVIDSLFNDGYYTIDNALLNDNDSIEEPLVVRNHDIYLTAQEIDNLTQVREIIVYTNMLIDNQERRVLIFRPEYTLSIHLALRAGLEMEIGDD